MLHSARFLRSISVAFALWVGVAPDAQAQLIQEDLLTPGDGLVSRDLIHGIDWLDLPLTTGLSIDDVLHGAGGWTADGWSLTTSADVCGLAGEVFGPTVACPTPTSSATIIFDDRAAAIIHFLGITSLGDQSLISAAGFSDDGDLSDNEAALGSFSFFVSTVDGDQSQFNLTNALGPSITSRNDSTGVLLVRPSPEPGAAALFGVSLLAVRRRRQR